MRRSCDATIQIAKKLLISKCTIMLSKRVRDEEEEPAMKRIIEKKTLALLP